MSKLTDEIMHEFIRKLQIAGDWGVIYTKSRYEKKVEHALNKKSVTVYLPTIDNRRSYRGSIRISQLPLFPGYLFFNSDEITRLELLNIDGVVKVIYPPDPQRLRKELLNLSYALSDRAITWRNMNFTITGQPVEITGGPLKGVEGEFVKFEEENLLIVRITFLGRAIETPIDEAFVRPLAI